VAGERGLSKKMHESVERETAKKSLGGAVQARFTANNSHPAEVLATLEPFGDAKSKWPLHC